MTTLSRRRRATVADSQLAEVTLSGRYPLSAAERGGRYQPTQTPHPLGARGRRRGSTQPCRVSPDRQVQLVEPHVHRFIAGGGLAVRLGAILPGSESFGQLALVNLVGLGQQLSPTARYKDAIDVLGPDGEGLVVANGAVDSKEVS